MTIETCRFCGCDDNHACETDDGPCGWSKPGYCSACYDTHLGQLVDLAVNFTPIDGATLAGWPCRVEDDGLALTIFDHIGVAVFQTRPDGVYLAPHYDALELAQLFERSPK